MDISEGKQALQKIQELEKQIEARLALVQKEANDSVASAKSKAEEMVLHKQKKLSALHQSLTDFRCKEKIPVQSLESPEIQANHKLVQSLANDLFKLLIKT